eukprot:5374813-Prorocentrum_lima.AAC.1
MRLRELEALAMPQPAPPPQDPLRNAVAQLAQLESLLTSLSTEQLDDAKRRRTTPAAAANGTAAQDSEGGAAMAVEGESTAATSTNPLAAAIAQL